MGGEWEMRGRRVGDAWVMEGGEACIEGRGSFSRLHVSPAGRLQIGAREEEEAAAVVRHGELAIVLTRGALAASSLHAARMPTIQQPTARVRLLAAGA